MDCSWIFLVFLLLLQFSEHISSVTVREGADVTLSCESVTPDQSQCEQTTWDFTSASGRTDLYVFGQKQSDSSGVSLSEDCSLVLERVSEEQVGVYRCQQYDEYYQQNEEDTIIPLSVVTLSEHRDNNRVTLSCSVRTFGVCRLSVKWTNKGKEVNKDDKELQTSHSECYSSVDFLDPDEPSQFDQTLKCEVTDENKQKLTFSPPSAETNPGFSGKKPQATSPNKTTVSTSHTRESLSDETEATSDHQTRQTQTEHISSVTVREGADVTLSCENVTPDQSQCEQTTWDFTSASGRTDLYVFGQKKSDSSGVSLSEDCSLVLERVSEEQVGVYRCQQYDEYYQQNGEDTIIPLSVVTLDGITCALC